MAGSTAQKGKEETGKTDSASAAQNRFVVSLPASVGEQIDRVGAKLAKAFEAETGVAFELSRAQIVQALVRQALKESEQVNGDSGGDAADNGTGE